MNKVICDICGTSYPEDAQKCPICGYSRDFKVEPMAEDEDFKLDDILLEDAEAEKETSTPAASDATAIFAPVIPEASEEDDEEDQDADDAEEEVDEEEEEEQRPSGFLIAMLVIVILALLVVSGFIFTRYFLPGMRSEATEVTTEATTVATEDTTVPTVPCTSLAMTSDSEVLLEQPGNSWLINVVAMPENTTDEIIYLSNNLDVATVDADGTVVAVGEGSAVISVVCGDFTVECNVTCAFAEEPSVPDETGTEPGAEEVTEPSEVIDGEETEATDVDTTEEATKAPTEKSTEAATEEATEAPTEAATEAPTEAATEAPTEEATQPQGDVKLQLSKADISFDRVGVYYTLKVANGIDPKDVEWSSAHGGVCVVKDGVITITGPGMTKVTAKYQGQEATCIVRVVLSGK